MDNRSSKIRDSEWIKDTYDNEAVLCHDCGDKMRSKTIHTHITSMSVS